MGRHREGENGDLPVLRTSKNKYSKSRSHHSKRETSSSMSPRRFPLKSTSRSPSRSPSRKKKHHKSSRDVSIPRKKENKKILEHTKEHHRERSKLARSKSRSRSRSHSTQQKNTHSSRRSPSENSNAFITNSTKDEPKEPSLRMECKPYQGGFSSAPPEHCISNFSSNSGGAFPMIIPPTTAAEIELDKKQRRLYIGNLPPGSRQDDVIAFFNGALLAVIAGAGPGANQANLCRNELPVTKCEVFNVDSRFCFLEFRTLHLTWLCLRLDGITFSGYSLRVGRPHDYVVPPTGDPAYSAVIPGFENLGEFKTPLGVRPDAEECKIYVQNIPQDMTEEEVSELVGRFGKLMNFNLLKDSTTGAYKGYGFFEFETPQIAAEAIQGLNGYTLGTQVLRAQRASVGSSSGTKVPGSVAVTTLQSSMTQKILSQSLIGLQVQAARKIGEKASNVVQLLNTVFQEDLIDETEYNDILQDIKQEAEKFGPLISVTIPRPNSDLSYREGVGKVFLHYSDLTAARKACMMLNGRKFDNKRTVCAAFYPEDKFVTGIYTLSQ